MAKPKQPPSSDLTNPIATLKASRWRSQEEPCSDHQSQAVAWKKWPSY